MAGLLSRFFGSRARARARAASSTEAAAAPRASSPSVPPTSHEPLVTQPAVQSVRATLFSGRETLEVVNESHHQDELWEMVGGRTTNPVRQETVALLIPDPDNPYDANAIEVRIDGLIIGHLSREDAATYRPGLIELMRRTDPPLIALTGMIVGGGRRGDRIGYLGVFLDHDPADFGLGHPHHVSQGKLRTGLSAAIADDDAEMGWYGQLPDDDLAASEELHALLVEEHDPVRRHYMFSELEHRLYRERAASPGMLDQFDMVCDQHHAEMSLIRPALVERFDAVPVIEMYRQAAIRCQKAGRWEVAREWARRGVDLYGDQAARPGIVDDLQHRVEYASSKLEQQSRPSSKRSPAPVRIEAHQVETLVCAECGDTFERVRTRGRKPRRCPRCRGHDGASADSPAKTS